MTSPSEDTRCKFCWREVEVEPKDGALEYKYRLGRMIMRVGLAYDGERICPPCLRTAASKAEFVE